MKVSYNWLKELTNIPVSPEELSVILTDCGLEVEELEYVQSLKGGLKGVVIGEVTHKEKHPNADKLSLTKVDVGAENLLQIVCGASNIEQGQKVVVATIGTVLYKGDETFTINRAKIRGVESEGMICAEDELGLGNSHTGIMVLPNNTQVGMPAAEYFQVTEDCIFTLGLTPNRIDAASHIGVARDIVAALNASGKYNLSFAEPDASLPERGTKDVPIKISVEDLNSCPRYSGITISNICVTQSPQWLKQRLSFLGQRPINNIVDITNYIMLEYGQPLHAFDINMIEGAEVIVKKYKTPAKFVTLDGTERHLSTEDLMICNASEGMCMAGVFGGLKSGVTEKTTSVFIESAYFSPTGIRRTSARHGLKTESSFRFERGTDPSATLKAMKHAASLICEIAGGTISSEMYDVYPVPVKKKEITLHWDFMKRISGIDIPQKIQKNILTDLDFELTKETDESVTLSAPYAKVDVCRPIDVAEEILRIYGYNKVPFSETMMSNLQVTGYPEKRKIINALSEMLTSLGFTEIMTNSLTKSTYYEAFAALSLDSVVKILNPLSNELNVLRKTMLFSGLEVIAHNINRKQSNLRLFEFGKVYSAISDSGKVTEQFQEDSNLALFISGNIQIQSWKHSNQLSDVFALKQYMMFLFQKLGLQKQLIFDPMENELFFYGMNIRSKKGTLLGKFGKISNQVLEIADCRQDVYYAELFTDELFELYSTQKIIAKEAPKFPEVQRDIAMLIDAGIQYDNIEKIVKQSGGKLLLKISLFDIYEGKNIPDGKKSYAIRLILQDDEKTLSDKETDAVVEKIKNSLIEQIGAIIR